MQVFQKQKKEFALFFLFFLKHLSFSRHAKCTVGIYKSMHRSSNCWSRFVLWIHFFVCLVLTSGPKQDMEADLAPDAYFARPSSYISILETCSAKQDIGTEHDIFNTAALNLLPLKYFWVRESQKQKASSQSDSCLHNCNKELLTNLRWWIILISKIRK